MSLQRYPYELFSDVPASTFAQALLDASVYGVDHADAGRLQFFSLAYELAYGANDIPDWGTWQMCNGTVGIAYEHKWDLEGCASPTTYAVQTGALPDGLTLTSITGNQGKISGTPTVAGTFNFTLRATNSVGYTDQAFSITISSAPVGTGGESSYIFVV